MSHPSKSGFTLMETVVVIALLTLVGGALANMIQFFYKTNTFVIQEGTAVQNARFGLDNAMQELRETSYGDDGSYPLASAATSTVTFYADVDNSGSVDKVRLYLSGGKLYRGVTHSAGTPPSYVGQPESVDIIASYVVSSSTSPVFQFQDDDGNTLPAPVNISLVSSVLTTIQIDVDPNRSPTVYTLLGSATLRNLRD